MGLIREVREYFMGKSPLCIFIVLIVILSLACVILGVQVAKGRNEAAPTEKGPVEFGYFEYKWYEAIYDGNANVGYVKNADKAREKARELWSQQFEGQSWYNPEDFPDEYLHVEYDTKEKIWHVYGKGRPSLEFVYAAPRIGGFVHAIFQKNGKVLSCWLEDAPQTRVREFELDDYSEELSTFSEDKNLGINVGDAELAVLAAQMAWNLYAPMYHPSQYFSFTKDNLILCYDAETKCWLIRGFNSDPDAVGGGIATIIGENGNVMALWYED